MDREDVSTCLNFIYVDPPLVTVLSPLQKCKCKLIHEIFSQKYMTWHFYLQYVIFQNSHWIIFIFSTTVLWALLKKRDSDWHFERLLAYFYVMLNGSFLKQFQILCENLEWIYTADRQKSCTELLEWFYSFGISYFPTALTFWKVRNSSTIRPRFSCYTNLERTA